MTNILLTTSVKLALSVLLNFHKSKYLMLDSQQEEILQPLINSRKTEYKNGIWKTNVIGCIDEISLCG